MDRAQGTKPAAVPVMATQAGEVRARWAWTEPAVWTERMLTALEQGVKGSKWFSLIDKVYRPANLLRAFARVKANKGVAGVDHQTIEMFEQHLEANLERLAVLAGPLGRSEIQEAARPFAQSNTLARPNLSARFPAVRSLADGGTAWFPGGSRMSGDVHVRFCESQWVRIPLATHLVILCRSEAEAQRALALVQQWTAEAGLTLHPEKTRIVDATKHGGFDFLGYHFERSYKWPRDKSLKKLKHKIRSLTKRNNGQSLQVIISGVNRVTQGWFAYFKHSHYPTFRPLDQWNRTRLRSILRKRGKTTWSCSGI